uniref:Cyclic nucleotide-binding domain-containing protein n=1 Tax=Ditylenchus dipsaci TaxID=166011 RepID=A0A915DYY0_9BILA
MVNTAKSKHNSTFAYLKRCRRLSRLTDGQLHVMAGLAREEQWTFRTEINSSQIAGRVYVITKGRITLRRQSVYSSAADLQSLGPGDIFGEVDRVNSLYFLQSGPPLSPSLSGGRVSPLTASAALTSLSSAPQSAVPPIPVNSHRKSLPIACLNKTPSLSSQDDCYLWTPLRAVITKHVGRTTCQKSGLEYYCWHTQ